MKKTERTMRSEKRGLFARIMKASESMSREYNESRRNF